MFWGLKLSWLKSVFLNGNYAGWLGLCLVCFSLAGCQPPQTGPARIQVSGYVTWKGQSLDQGTIHLFPQEGPRSEASGAEIRNGKYTVTNKGGVLPGTYRVEFTANRKIPPVTSEDGSEIDFEQYLPESVNSKSEIMLVVPDNVRTLKQDFQLTE